MHSKSKIAVGSLLATAATATALALPAASQAASPGDLCKLAVLTTVSGVFPYFLPAGSNVRIVDYSGPSNYYGHGEGRTNGTFPRFTVDQSTCH